MNVENRIFVETFPVHRSMSRCWAKSRASAFIKADFVLGKRQSPDCQTLKVAPAQRSIGGTPPNKNVEKIKEPSRQARRDGSLVYKNVLTT